MDTRLLRLYSDELTHLREMGTEFAQDFPKIAARLGLEGMEVADPYVERLLEGFAFLSARIQLKLDAEQPRLIAHLLESLYPNFLAPMPSMLVARLTVDVNDPNLAKGHAIPRDSDVQSELPRGQDTSCEFRTAHAVTLWPVEITEMCIRDSCCTVLVAPGARTSSAHPKDRDPMNPRRKVLLVDDHELVRLGVKTTCSELFDMPIDWLEAQTLQDAVRLYAETPGIDAVLLDLNLADCKGLQLSLIHI